MSKKISSSTRYAFAFGSVALAAMVRMVLTPLLGTEFPILSFYLAVVFTTWFAGFSPGVLSVVLGLVAADAFVYTHSSAEADPLTMTLYLVITLTITFFGKAMHEAKRRAELSAIEARQLRRDMEQRQNELDHAIGEVKKTEYALGMASDHFAVLFENAAVGMAQIEPSTGRFLRVNAKLCQITGFSAEEMLKMNVRQLTLPGDGEWDTRALRRMIEGQTPDLAFERRYVAKDGRVIWVNVSAAMVRNKDDGRPICTLSVVQDITARRHAEDALQAAQVRMKNFNAELDRQVAERTTRLNDTVQALEGFCYTVGHDLRTPIRAVHGYASVLAEKCSLDPQALNYTEHICRSATRMDQMVQDLLTYGRLAREPMPCEAVHLAAVVNDVLARLACEIESTKAEITVERPLPQVLGHPDALEQVVLHLLRNAMKFVHPGDKPRIAIRAEEVPGGVRVWVNDNGIGIDAQNHEKIFQLFERVHRSGEYKGTGTGLAIVKKAIERMGGRVGVVSIPGNGSSFWFELGEMTVAQNAAAV